MSAWLIAFVGVQYLAISIWEMYKGRPELMIVFGGYAISNVGLWMAAR